jgi:hypothetical protein
LEVATTAAAVVAFLMKSRRVSPPAWDGLLFCSIKNVGLLVDEMTFQATPYRTAVNPEHWEIGRLQFPAEPDRFARRIWNLELKT